MRELPPIFVISLPDSARRPRMAERLAAWPGGWSFIEAIDGMALSPVMLAGLYDEAETIRRYGRPLSPGEVGCALSHRRTYETILQRGLASAIVLEDDAVISSDLSVFPFGSVPESFDIVNLLTSSGLVQRRPERVAGRYGLHRAAGRIDGAAGYLISRKGAEKLLAATRTISHPADWPVHPQDLSFFALVPDLVRHEGEDSHLDAAREETRHRWRRRRGLKRALTEGILANVAVPLFIRYVIERDCYRGVADYYRRELEPPMKRMLPMFYLRLGGR